ncbi:MAG: diamine N-acetyltransferase [Thermotogota bacterium]|nr:diamine N-acetyltransferase [Thermotogota bacterium]
MLSDGELLLRPISLNDTEFILKLRNDLEMSQNFFSDPPLYDFHHIEWLKSQRNDIDLIIEVNNQRAGRIRVYNLDFRNQRCEYGIELLKAYRGKGIAKKSSTLLINYVFNNLPVRKIYLYVFEDNVDAIKLYERLGFEVEGIFKEEYFKCGKWKNVLRMALFKDKWLRGF